MTVGCRGTLTAGLPALSADDRWSALTLVLACGPDVANGGEVTAATGGGEACDEVVAWAGVKADDGDGMDVTFRIAWSKNEKFKLDLGCLLKIFKPSRIKLPMPT